MYHKNNILITIVLLYVIGLTVKAKLLELTVLAPKNTIIEGQYIVEDRRYIFFGLSAPDRLYRYTPSLFYTSKDLDLTGFTNRCLQLPLCNNALKKFYVDTGFRGYDLDVHYNPESQLLSWQNQYDGYILTGPTYYLNSDKKIQHVGSTYDDDYIGYDSLGKFQDSLIFYRSNYTGEVDSNGYNVFEGQVITKNTSGKKTILANGNSLTKVDDYTIYGNNNLLISRTARDKSYSSISKLTPSGQETELLRSQALDKPFIMSPNSFLVNIGNQQIISIEENPLKTTTHFIQGDNYNYLYLIKTLNKNKVLAVDGNANYFYGIVDLSRDIFKAIDGYDHAISKNLISYIKFISEYSSNGTTLNSIQTLVQLDFNGNLLKQEALKCNNSYENCGFRLFATNNSDLLLIVATDNNRIHPGVIYVSELQLYNGSKLKSTVEIPRSLFLPLQDVSLDNPNDLSSIHFIDNQRKHLYSGRFAIQKLLTTKASES